MVLSVWKIENLIEQCWQFDPTKRPTFDEIVKILLTTYSVEQQQENNDEI